MNGTASRLLAAASLLAAVTGSLAAQTPKVSMVFTNRFNSVSLDVANDRTNGALTAVRAFDLAVVTPGAGAIARSWVPTTAHQAMWGDANNTGNYAQFQGWNPFSAPNQFNFTAPFVRHADRNKGNPMLAYFTVRDESTTAPTTLNVFTNNGTSTYQVKPGDYFRWGKNGNAEFFITRALILKAKGAPPVGRVESPGIGALCQDAAGNLYWSPQQGGHWVSGNNGPTTPVYCNDGGIVMLDAADITYDANGNVLDVVADKAHMLFEEVTTGPNGQPHIRGMVGNAGAYNYTGTALLTTTTKMVGLQLDPSGGTVTASWPVGTVYPVVPNFVFTWDSGSWAGTIFTTAVNPANNQPGVIATINGVKCGSDQNGIPATGAWWGLQQNVGAFTPTTMGFALIDELKDTPFSADAPNDGAILQADTAIYVDLFPGANVPTYLLLAVGPLVGGKFQGSVDVSGNALIGNDSWKQLFPAVGPALITAGLGNANGYLHFQLPNIWSPALVGLVVEFQGLKISTAYPGQLALSNPVQMQFK